MDADRTPHRLVAAGLAATLFLAGCTDGPRYSERRLYAMGTWVDIAVVAPRRIADAAFDDAESLLRGFEVDYYAWADGELAKVNRALANGGEATATPEMAELLIEARRLALASGGAFDPAVGALVELWGFHTAPGDDAQPPDTAAIERWLRSGASIAAVEISERRIASGLPGIKLDLGGIAKGEAVDRLATLLARHGIRDAMINAGGDLRVLGRRDGRPWRIGIQAPDADGVIGVIELEDGEAAFTSGDYERYFDSDGRKMHHILDPRTGYPAAGTRAVTVIAPGGVLADAAATALFVSGASWRPVAAALGVDAVLRVEASGRIEATEAMHGRVVHAGAEHWDVVADS